ncbi:MAG: nitrous oxide reductase family maturation protein NosD [Dehalococcoidia bacterium]
MKKRLFLPWMAAAAVVVGGLAMLGSGRDVTAATATVAPGQSIQDAIDEVAAGGGGTVTVLPGTYAEAIEINNSGITLKGSAEGVIIVPPPPSCPEDADAAVNCVAAPAGEKFSCAGSGICIWDVSNVTIKRLTVQGFEESGVILFETSNVTVSDVRAIDNDEYGIAAFASWNVTLYRNFATGAEDAGIYIGDSSNAQNELRLNRTNGNALGILVRNSSGVMLKSNTSNGNCAGILLLVAHDISVSNNTLNSNTLACEEEEEDGSPPISGNGLLIADSYDITITGNSINGNVGTSLGGSSEPNPVEGPPSGGIVVYTIPNIPPPPDPVSVTSDPGWYIVTSGNFLRRNSVDFHWGEFGPNPYSSGTQNRCKSAVKSTPGGFCNFDEVVPAP